MHDPDWEIQVGVLLTKSQSAHLILVTAKSIVMFQFHFGLPECILVDSTEIKSKDHIFGRFLYSKILYQLGLLLIQLKQGLKAPIPNL